MVFCLARKFNYNFFDLMHCSLSLLHSLNLFLFIVHWMRRYPSFRICFQQNIIFYNCVCAQSVCNCNAICPLFFRCELSFFRPIYNQITRFCMHEIIYNCDMLLNWQYSKCNNAMFSHSHSHSQCCAWYVQFWFFSYNICDAF